MTEEKMLAIAKALDSIKPKKSFTKKIEQVAFLFPQIEGLVEKGYSYEEIAQFLTDNGLSLSRASLSNYLSKVRKEIEETDTPPDTKTEETEKNKDKSSKETSPDNLVTPDTKDI